MAYKRSYSDVRRKAKVLNQRMRELEKRGIKSPAYRAMQAKLEMLGKKPTATGGRRFSETDKYEWAEMEAINAILDKAMSYKTSTLKGAKQYYDDVWQSALNNPELGLKGSGITREQWFEFWENMPSKIKDRTFSSGQNVAFLISYVNKHGSLKNEDTLSAKEIAEEIEAASSLKEAYKHLGLSMNDIRVAKDLGVL